MVFVQAQGRSIGFDGESGVVVGAWEKTLWRTVAVSRGKPVDPEVRWCLAESVWRFADENGLVVQSFREVDPRSHADIPASAAQLLGARRDEFDWHLFKAVVTRA